MVRLLESSSEAGQQMLGSSKAVRLKGNQQPARTERFQGSKCHLDLCRVMPVIVVDAKAFVVEKQLLAARSTGEFFKCSSHPRRVIAKPVQQSNDRAGIGRVLFAFEANGKFPEAITGGPNFKLGSRSGCAELLNSIPSKRMKTVRDGTRMMRVDFCEPKIVSAKDHVARRLRRELLKLS